METPPQALRPAVDLTNCDREPIHIPGAIQPHGLLFALCEPDLTISHVSANCASVLGIPSGNILKHPFTKLVRPAAVAEVTKRLNESNLDRNNPFPLDLTAADGEPLPFLAIAHRHAGCLLIELESAPDRAEGPFRGFYHDSREAVSRLRSSRSLEELYAGAVAEIRRMTNFDRVTLYKFDELWNGHVLAEEVKAGVASYLDLHFPASDIPKQARDLYRLNRIRIIPEVPYKPVPIVAAAGPAAPPLDLTLAVLRSVSPIHVEYLRNMQATASMSISLLQEGHLWGLISCTHEGGALPISFEARAVCDLVGEITSSLLSLRESAETQASIGRKSALQTRLLETMSREDDFVAGLEKNQAEFLDLAGATGAAVHHQGTFRLFGRVPTNAQLHALIQWFASQPNPELVMTDSLPGVMEGAAEFKDVACGLLAFAISRAQGTSVMWFRPEVVQTVKWGGDPTKPVDPADARALHPRKSFEAWKETVRLKALSWRKPEIEAAQRLRSSIIDIVLQKVERISSLNRELERSNVDLDSFAYAASHDLKEPLRGIHNYSSLLLRSVTDRLKPEELGRLETIARLTQRMEDLINSLLNYSQVGRSELAMAESDMNEVLRVALDSLRQRIEEAGAEVRAKFNLPRVVCDGSQIVEVFTNLISNAIKYNDSKPKIVEVGAVTEGDKTPVFFVRDNGIGIEREHYAGIFKIFRRLHAKDKYGGGTGTGLTITEKIIERHGGRLWLESRVGEGTTFYFTLGDRSAGGDS